MFETHLDIINRRWPSVGAELTAIQKPDIQLEIKQHTLSINSIQLTSDVDRQKESLIQASMIPQDSEVAYLFGTGLGDCQQTLLARDHLQHLHVVIMNMDVFWCSLNVSPQDGWLSDKRVQLHTSETIKDVAFPFLALPAEMALCDDRSAQLRDRLAIELNHQFVSKRFSSDEAFSERMRRNLPLVKQDASISELSSPGVDTVLVCGAGPTLADHIPWIKENKPFLIAVDAAINTLLAHQIYPEIVVSIDHTSAKLFDEASYDVLSGASLVYFPNSDSDLLTRWKGKRYASYSNTPMYAEVKREVALEPLFSAGSVIHPAVDLANKLGAKTVVLLGTDFSFVYGKSHAKGNESGYQQSADLATQWVVNSRGDRVPTMANLKAYLRDLERYIERHPQINFFNGSANGAKIEGTTLWKK